MRLYQLIEQIFCQPCCKIRLGCGMGGRQICIKYLRELERLGVLRGCTPRPQRLLIGRTVATLEATQPVQMKVTYAR